MLNIKLRKNIEAFCRDTYGGITAFTAVIFLIMVISVGMAVDFMRHETYRAELQDAVDRGLLAATAFSQTMNDEEEILRAYIKSTNFVRNGYDLTVVPSYTTGTRTIDATATYQVNTFFLRLLGIPTLDIVASGTAVEGASWVEISLALDISSSMAIETAANSTQTRLSLLKSSAKQFIDDIYKDAYLNRMTVSLVPFSGQVNLGPVAMGHFTSSTVHSYSNCVELDPHHVDYVTPLDDGDPSTVEYANPLTTISQAPAVGSTVQMQHFNFSIYSQDSGGVDYKPENVSEIDWGWCPSDAQQVEYFSANPDRLKTRIDGLRTHEATGTHYGVKWAATLLDPSANALTSALVTANVVDSEHSSLPRSYADREVKKYMILMSDGRTTGQTRVDPQSYQNSVDYQFWDENLSSNQGNDFEVYSISGLATSNDESRQEARAIMANACQAAKDNGVVIFAIGFDIDVDTAEGLDAQSDLQDCATDDTKYFLAEGDGIKEAFTEIALTIQKLKLLN